MKSYVYNGMILSCLLLVLGCVHHPQLRIVTHEHQPTLPGPPLPGNGVSIKQATTESATILIVQALTAAEPGDTKTVTVADQGSANWKADVVWTVVRQKVAIQAVLKTDQRSTAKGAVVTYSYISKSAASQLPVERALQKGEEAILFADMGGRIIKIVPATEKNQEAINKTIGQ